MIGICNEKLNTIHIVTPPLPSKKKKYLVISLTKYIKDLYVENYKTLIKVIKNLNKWKDTPCLWIRRLNYVKMSILLNFICIVNVIPIKIPASFCGYQQILKFIWKGKRP